MTTAADPTRSSRMPDPRMRSFLLPGKLNQTPPPERVM
jgi:hypothetical protein